MHDPMTVAFEIRRPWPRIDGTSRRSDRRWSIRLHHDCGSDCEDRAEHARRNPFPWWRLRSYSAFWTLAGRRFYWPPIITIWHVEPNGHDSGEVCKHHIRYQDEGGRWRLKRLRAWRWHFWHWKAQVIPLQNLRRWALTRCEWCGGRSRKDDRVNVSHQWDRKRGPWWRGERGLFHSGCSSVHTAHRLCLCDQPLLNHGDYGQCAFCGKFRAWRKEPNDADRILAALPAGSRIPESAKPLLQRIWAEVRAEGERQETDT